MITRDPHNLLSAALLHTDFSDNNYWANNFNDMFSAMNVLFNLLVINNWTQCEAGFEAVTGTKWVRLFFLSFHLFGVILVNNLVVAFIISSFLEQLPIVTQRAAEDEVLEGGEAVLRGRWAILMLQKSLVPRRIFPASMWHASVAAKATTANVCDSSLLVNGTRASS